MQCKTHDLPLKLICDHYVCGMCYQDTLLTEKLVAGKDQDFELRLVDLGNGHHGKKIKAFHKGREIS